MISVTLLRRSLVLAVALLVAAALPALAAEIRLTDDGFDPDSVTVEPGETITWVNDTDDEHTVTAEDGSWDSGPLQPGESFSVALRAESTTGYETDDGEHTGEVVVVAAEVDDEDAGDADPEAEDEEPAMPTTGLALLPLLGLSLALLGGGAILVRRAA